MLYRFLLYSTTALILIAVSTAVYFQSSDVEKGVQREVTRTSGAGLAMDAWVFERAYPLENIPTKSYIQAFESVQQQKAQRLFDGEWESLGPENVGGRTLCLAFHPTDPDIMYAGSASGGLWKSTSRGLGQYAWSPVSTGYPVLGVASIAIDPDDPDVMYIGTGETYGGGVSEPGIVNRYTRGTYGIGILRTDDGGANWSTSLAFDQDAIKGVQDIEVSVQNSSEVYAATSDGVYQTTDGGENWELILSLPDCFDIELDPQDPDVIYVSQGNLNNALDPLACGIFKSENHGESFFELMDAGLLNVWSGNAKLTLDPTDSNILYADIQVGWYNTDPTTPAGIYRSDDAGMTWTNINNQNIALYQGWYSHDLAIDPNNPSNMMYVGIDAWHSSDGGGNFIKESLWTQWDFGVLDVTQPEGGPNYVHADIHAAYYHPLVEDEVYLATDGGVFGSQDGGLTYTTLNGGFQTTQFYANMGSSATDPNRAICGAQDNATYIYDGIPSWRRVIGGDGMCAAIDPIDEDVMYGSYQNLNILKSENGGANFYGSGPNLASGELVAFNGPFQMAPSDGNVIYAGAQRLYRSTTAATFWEESTSSPVDGDNVIITIEVSNQDPEVLMLATSPSDPFNGPDGAKVFRSTNGGEDFTEITGLPDRVCKDLAFDPTDDQIAYAVFSGFGTGHVFKTVNGGEDWFLSDLGLPDLPTNTIVVDPNIPDHVYVGNDLSVYFSSDAGETWNIWDEGLPEATIMMHLSISPANNKLRIATHGRGLFQRDLEDEAIGIVEEIQPISGMRVVPNPVSEVSQLTFFSSAADEVSVVLYDNMGQILQEVYRGAVMNGKNQIPLNGLRSIATGAYHLQVSLDGRSYACRFLKD